MRTGVSYIAARTSLVAIGIKSDSNNLGGESLTYLKTLRLIR